MCNHLGFILLLLAATPCVNGYDPFQGAFVGSNCQKCLCDLKTSGIGCGEQLTDAFLPKSETAVGSPDTEFFLYTRENRVSPECLHKNGGRLRPDSHFVPDAVLHVIFLAFSDGVCTYAYSREIRDEILERCNCTVMIVDWHWGGSTDLAGAMINAKVVAEQTEFVLRNIMEQTKITPSKFYFIGWSLGGQLAGLVGKLIDGVYRITALDPAGSAYIQKPPSEKLTKDDAEIVDVIHTNGGDCVITAFGYPTQLGHADFYVNGGFAQPNCFSVPFEAFLKMDYKFAAITSLPMICSHAMSMLYFKSSINPKGCQFVGFTDPSAVHEKTCSCGKDGSECAIMGYDYPTTHKNDGRNHTYYVEAKFPCPYCIQEIYDGCADKLKETNEPGAKDAEKPSKQRNFALSAVLGNIARVICRWFDAKNQICNVSVEKNA